MEEFTLTFKNIFNDFKENQFDGIAYDFLAHKTKFSFGYFEYQNYQDDNKKLLPLAMEEFEEKYAWDFNGVFYMSFDKDDIILDF